MNSRQPKAYEHLTDTLTVNVFLQDKPTILFKKKQVRCAFADRMPPIALAMAQASA